jgi:arginyl-tRNA--protein-N-Asp/Glu arginylyltransferase
MKLIFSEYKADYSKYHFPYQVYLMKEESDELNKIYDMGFLPSRAKLNLFYLARSLRVDLSKFEPSSENRRILRKTESLQLTAYSLREFEYGWEIGKLAKDFYDKRFGKGTMSANKIKWLFTSGACSDVLEYKDSGKTIGYCLVNNTGQILHYAYPFYELEYFDKNAGMGMMLRAILHAKEEGLKYVYLGTCYTEESLYKTQFKGIEYFTGFSWSRDIEKLKELIREKQEGHLLESVENKDEIFERKGISF